MSQRVGLPSSLTGATLSRSGEGVTLNNPVASPAASTPQSTPILSPGLGSQPPTGGISMANLFGNPSLSATVPPATPSPMGSSMPNLPAASLSAPNPLSGLLSNQSPSAPAASSTTPLLTATPATFTPPVAQTFSQQPLPTLGQPSQPLAKESMSPRGATSGKRNVKSGRRQSSEIFAPAPVEMDIATAEPPKKGWGYIFSPLNIIFLILVFIIVFITLYGSRLNLVTDLDNGERVLNNRKLILWSVVITVVIAVLGFIIMSAIAKRRR